MLSLIRRRAFPHTIPATLRTAASLCERSNYADDINFRIRSTLPEVAQRMIDNGALQHLMNKQRGLRGENFLQHYMKDCVLPEDRHEIVVAFNVLQRRLQMMHRYCDHCLYLRSRCICDHIQFVQPRNKLWLFQHIGEYGRCNNTGSLLCAIAGAQRTTRGIQKEQNAMLNDADNNKHSAVIVFPGENSMTLPEYQQWRKNTFGADIETKALHLFLLDGTSRQAKNLDRFMPDWIPRVRLHGSHRRSWLNPIRRQTESHRVCTAQGMYTIDSSYVQVIMCAVSDIVLRTATSN